MDQLDVNLSELRVALVGRQRIRTSRMPPSTPFLNLSDYDDKLMTFEASTEQSAPDLIELEPARSWLQRLFGA